MDAAGALVFAAFFFDFESALTVPPSLRGSIEMTVVINPNINAQSGLDRKQFLSRLSSVIAVRTNRNSQSEGLSFYIHSLDSFNYYRYLKNAICSSDFSGLDGRYRVRHFGLDVPEPLLRWFERCELAVIQRQVVCWLTALYARDPTKRYIMEEQIYPPVMSEIKTLFNDHFDGRADYENNDVDIVPIYMEACNYYYNSIPPEILSHPCTLQFSREAMERWNVMAPQQNLWVDSA